MMAETVLLQESKLNFSYYSDWGVYGSSNLSPTFQLEAGVEYTVVWDTETYKRTAFAFTGADGSQCVGVGNPIAAGQAANDDKFCVVYDKTHNYVHYLSLETTASHTIAISTEVAQAEIVLLDRPGNPMNYTTDVLRIPTADGRTKDYVASTPVEKTVELDFSDGDMEVTPGKGELFEKVNIPVPAGLMPEHIPEGMTIAGIVGTMVAAGGANVVYASGELTGVATADYVVTHNLGVVPDMIVIYTAGSSAISANNTVRFHFGFSKAFAELVGKAITHYTLKVKKYTTNVYYISQDYGTPDTWIMGYIDSTSGMYIPVYGANAETFTLTNTTAGGALDSALTYNWVAIGGIT